jgi:CubicO group peptidase (beta-lactamase class C family)
MFAVGSVTKQFTCSAVLLLAQEKKLSLQDRVAKYLPQLTRAGDVTLLDLGQHVSGYRDYYPLDFVDREMLKPQSADSIIAEYAKRPLDFDPGTRWSYSNTNFLILGQVVEKVSGQSFQDFLTQRFFSPLGMSNTRFDPARGAAQMAMGYTSFALGAPIPATPEGAGWAGAAGAIWSTPRDLLAWDMSLLDRKLLTEESYRTLTTARRLADGRSTGYGCGESVHDRGDAVVIEHGGAVSGFLAQNTLIPATRSAVVLLTNSDYAPLDDLDSAITRRLVPEVDVPEIHGPPALEAARAFLTALEQGQVDRSTLGEDFNAFLTPEHLASARTSLGRLGKITDLRVDNTAERGGMEVAVLHFRVGRTNAQAYMYRTPDGKIQELLIARE